MRSLSRHPALCFAISATAILAACLLVLRSQLFATHPDVAAWGITFDLTVSIPLLYWFFVVRSGKRSASADPHERIAAAAKALAGEGVVANLLTSELATFYYAFFGWRQQPEPRERAVTFHQRNGWGTIVICIYVMIAAEGLAMHLFLARSSTLAAWSWTALDLWAALWLLGDYHGLRLRRSWIDDDALHIHYGLRWTVTIPRELIASVSEIHNENDWKRKDVLKIAMLDEPRWLITLREPVIAHGMAGFRKEIRALAILPDQDDWIANLQ